MLGLSACVSGHVQSDSTVGTTTGDAKTNSADPAQLLPFEAVLRPSEAGYRLLDRAVDDLIGGCMKSSGYGYEPYPDRPLTPVLDVRRRYGAISEMEAMATGYRSLVPTDGPPGYVAEVDRIDAARSNDGAGYLAALYGPNGDGGCRAEASNAVWAAPTGLTSMPGYPELIDLSAESFDRLLVDPDSVASDAAWSACMADRGYDFRSWTDAPATFLTPGSSVSQPEIDQATADVSCRNSADLLARLFAAETRIQNEMIDDNFTLVDDFAGRLSAAVDRAKKLEPDQ
ncbi:MAG: hypothetical protein ABIR32_22875 [Ilumatobacteraceae bacterium]